MSHFSEVKTNLKSKKSLQAALMKLGFQIEECTEGVEVRGFFGETQKADFKVLTKTHYDIGFKLSDNGTYEIVGDWELLPQVSDIDQNEFTNSVKREYARAAITELAREKGYELEISEDSETNQIELVVSQW